MNLFDPSSFSESVGIVGLGNIGSQTAVALARLGIQQMTLYDNDVVEGHNLSSQAYRISDIGEKKTTSLKDILLGLNNKLSITVIDDMYPVVDTLTEDITIIAVDTMKERKRIQEILSKNKKEGAELIDARMGGGQIEVYHPASLEAWKETFTDHPSTDPCGGRYISYVSMATGSLVANVVKRILKKEPHHASAIFHMDTLDIIKK